MENKKLKNKKNARKPVNKGASGNSGTSVRIFNAKAFYIVLILVLTAVLYSPSLKNDFIYNWDDNINVTENPLIQQLSKESVSHLFSFSNPIPEPRLTWFSYALQFSSSGLNPYPYHLINVLLHILNVLLVFLFINRLSKNLTTAVVAAALFAFHPLNVEAVSWITGRKDLLYTLFYLGSLLIYLQYLKKEKPWLFLVAIVLAEFSVMSKIQGLAIFGSFFILDFFHGRKPDFKLIAEKITMLCFLLPANFRPFHQFIMAASFMLVSYGFSDKSASLFSIGKNLNKVTLLQLALLLLCIGSYFAQWPVSIPLTALFIVSVAGKMTGNPNLPLSERRRKIVLVSAITLAGAIVLFIVLKQDFIPPEYWGKYSVIDRLFMAARALSFYLVKVIAPFYLIMIHPYPEAGASLPWDYYAALPFIAAIFFGVVLLLKKVKDKALKRLTIAGLLFFIVNISFVLHIIPIGGRVIVAERYPYLAYIGLFLIAGMFVSRTYSSAEKTARKVKTPIKYIMLTLLAVFMIQTYQRQKVWKDGITLYTDLIGKRPDYAMAYNNRGFLYSLGFSYGKPVQHKVNEAMQDFNMALRLEPDNKEAIYNKTLLNIKIQNFNEAITACNQAIQKDSTWLNMIYLKGYAHYKTGANKEAIFWLTKAINLKPDHAYAYYNRANAKIAMGETTEALNDFYLAIKSDPDFADAYVGRGIMYYETREYDAALTDYNKALSINPKNIHALYARALVFMVQRRKAEACADFRQAASMGHAGAIQMEKDYCLKN
ncbi:MAG: tetratricopeptide repeat protein [Bacteroidetes bacterium]|nr:tetratricopeptide repeat protein [Bacteroidota bacterium]MBU1719925.1 tetratricopeptide repeat protein [Bacteroidota bacterium]